MKFPFKNIHLFLGFSFSLFFSAHFLEKRGEPDLSKPAESIEKKLHQKERLADDYLRSYANIAESESYEKIFSEKFVKDKEALDKEGIAILIYENDSLKFWSNNSIAVENYFKQVCLDDQIAKLKNGWFQVLKSNSKPLGSKVVIALIHIKSEFPYQNKYLHNEFAKDFGIKEGLLLSTKTEGAPIKNRKGQFLFSLVQKQNTEPSSSPLIIFINILAIILLVKYLFEITDKFSRPFGRHAGWLLLFAILVLLRFLCIKAKFPESFYSLPLFNPEFYGDANNFWRQSLGDLLFNALLMFAFSYFIYKTDDSIIATQNKLLRKIIPFSILLGILALGAAVNSSIGGLINNSGISFNVNNLFSLNRYSYIAIIIICLWLISFFILTLKSIRKLEVLLDPKEFASLLATAFICFFIFYYFFKEQKDMIMHLWAPVIAAFVFFVQTKRSFSFLNSALLVLLFSFYAGHVILKQTGIKEKKERLVFAQKLAVEQDPVAEHLYNQTLKNISSDTTLTFYLESLPAKADSLIKRLHLQHFGGYWEKYDIRVSLFDSTCTFLACSGPQQGQAFYEETIKTQGYETMGREFYYIENNSGKVSYIAKINIYDRKKQRILATAYVEAESKFISDEIGFPELLLDREAGFTNRLAEYSYAKYKNNKLVNRFGNFEYNNTGDDFEVFSKDTLFLEMNGNEHLYYKANGSLAIVLTKKTNGFLNDVTVFSYLFAFFSLFILFLLLFRSLALGAKFQGISFKNRIQFVLVLIILLSLLLFGAGSIYYIQKQYESKNKENINEKIHSVLVELENKLGEEELFKPGYKEYTAHILKNLSGVFFTDISLYDKAGNLFATSRPKLYEEGLTSLKMNPEAYLNVSLQQKTGFIHEEKIGELNYLSAYVPFKNKAGEVQAYVNLPYFAKQSDLEKEIASFLVAIINIYVLLFGFSIIIALLISNFITRPLKLIQDKLGKIKLGKTNEYIEWKEKDEIGSLVAEYNRMISELSKSAELLAKSERESAWREMAKQVAHEIKNPLTPMKLSLQHLQKIQAENRPGKEQKIESTIKTMIEQIEALSTIANEFSSFAKMPKAQNEKTDIIQIIKASVELFRNTTEAEFIADFKENECFVLADKEQLLRVFNNIIKNALQAIPEERKGQIEISENIQNNKVVVAIKDNGTGIGKEAINKIFTPSFTTKTGGTGLGLAMSKNIIESFSGSIWFKTDAGETTFYISLPVYKE